MDRIVVRLIVKGRVQGAGYRWWAQEQARRLGLQGWVRNRDDGTVELAAAGPHAAVQEMVEACWSGPPAAAVHIVERAPIQDQDFNGFSERPTV